MPAVTIRSSQHPDGYFPDDSQLRVEWVHDQRDTIRRGQRITTYRERKPVWCGSVSGQVTRNLDVGKYVYKIHKWDKTGRESFREGGTILVGMTQDEWKRFSHEDPVHQFARTTSDGIIFECKWPGCGKKTTGKMSSLVHERDKHYPGTEKMLSDPNRVEIETTDFRSPVKSRGPGRPRKEAVG